MNLFLAYSHSSNPFDLKAALLARHAQHPVIMRSRLRAKGNSPRVAYFTVTGLALMAITLTGHLGGFLSGVEAP